MVEFFLEWFEIDAGSIPATDIGKHGNEYTIRRFLYYILLFNCFPNAVILSLTKLSFGVNCLLYITACYSAWKTKERIYIT